jgi:penicillin-binding protein 1A
MDKHSPDPILNAFADHCARVLAVAFLVVAVPLSLLFLMPAGLKAMAGPLDPVMEHAASAPEAYSLTFLDADGKMIGRQGPVTGVALGLRDLPAYLPAAFMAVEDRRFFHHDGIDPLGLMRAAYANLRAGQVVAGGSTISQQTAKLLSNDRERSFGRKFRELLNTAALERRYSKQQILALYLNHIYLGESAYGVDAAARSYFGVSAREVNLAQAAMLAGLTRAPSVFSPRRDPVTAQRRAEQVLAAMVSTGAITPQAAAEARAHPAELVAAKRDDHNYVLDAAALEARQVLADNGVAAGAFVVQTTLQSRLQQQAQTIATAAVREQGRRLGFSQAALVVMTPEGAIAAMVGGVNYGTSVFNRVTQAHRQPGSAFKPFVYATALERGISPWEWRDDQAVNISGYQPINYHHASYGRLRLIDALARSVNTISVNLAQEVGVGMVAATARRLGITSTLHSYASLALGTDVVTPLELTSAYAAFAEGGRVRPYLVRQIDNAFDGATAWRRETPARSAVIADSVRRDMTAMLYQVVQGGTGTAARLGNREAAGKTGTSQEYRDAWFVGFTADHVAGVWVGNDDNSPMRGVTGGLVPARLWRQVMLAADTGLAPRPLDRTQGAPAELLPPAEPAYEEPEPYPVQQPASQPVRYVELQDRMPRYEAPSYPPMPAPAAPPTTYYPSYPALSYVPPVNSAMAPSAPSNLERPAPTPYLPPPPVSYYPSYPTPSYVPPVNSAMVPGAPSNLERPAPPPYAPPPPVSYYPSYPTPSYVPPVNSAMAPPPERAPPPREPMTYQQYVDRAGGAPYRYDEAPPYQPR